MKKILSVLLLFTIPFLLSGCAALEDEESIQANALLFDTVIRLEIWGTNNQEFLNECLRMCEEYEQRFSRTIDTSEISKINHAGGAPVTVSDETIALLNLGIYYGELSGGGFDITVAPLSILWDFKNNKGFVPSQAEIDEARSHVNYKNISIEGNTVTLSDPKAAIDLGGIAKGYIADRLKEYLESKGVEHSIISLGGNILTIGTKPDGSSYAIGIQRPFDERNAVITSVEVAGKSVVSSGVYERYFETEDRLYHHILDPQTGYPVESNLLGVTIISDASVDGDGLSTTCFALGLTDGMALIESLDGIDAIFITDDYKLHDTRK